MTFEEWHERKAWFDLLQAARPLTPDEAFDYAFLVDTEAHVISNVRYALRLIAEGRVFDKVQPKRQTTYHTARPHISGGKVRNPKSRPAKDAA